MKTHQFAEILRRERELLGLSQEFMAAKLNFSQSAYSRIENGEANLSITRWEEILKILEMESARVQHTLDQLHPMKQGEYESDAFSELEYGAQTSIVGADSHVDQTPSRRKISRIMNKLGKGVIKFVVSLAISEVMWKMTEGFCDGYGTSATSKFYASWTVALISLIFTYYYLSKLQKRYNKLKMLKVKRLSAPLETN